MDTLTALMFEALLRTRDGDTPHLPMLSMFREEHGEAHDDMPARQTY